MKGRDLFAQLFIYKYSLAKHTMRLPLQVTASLNYVKDQPDFSDSKALSGKGYFFRKYRHIPT
jgi:hypothetical protein